MLRELQKELRRALLEGDTRAIASRVVADRVPAEARIGIYRGNTITSLTHVLAEAFPVCRQVTGEDNFGVVARQFIKACPPRRPYLFSYGDRFPEFLRNFSPAMGDHPFIADLASLEWAYVEALFAADAPTLAPEQIKAIPRETYPSLRFRLHPATRMMETDFEVLPMWTGELDPAKHRHACPEGKQFILLTRPSLDIRHAQISPGDFAMLAALDEEEPLERAAARAMQVEPGFDLLLALAAHLAHGTFTGITGSA